MCVSFFVFFYSVYISHKWSITIYSIYAIYLTEIVLVLVPTPNLDFVISALFY